MSHQQQRQPQAGSSVQTQTGHEAVPESSRTVGVLKLRGGPARRKVMWEEGTVDNEGMGKKKSKICCIYHRPKAFDESSSESDITSDEGSGSDTGLARHLGNSKGKGKAVGGGDESSESEGGMGNGAAKPAKRKVRRSRHKHSHGPCDGDHEHGHSHDPSPNRYDKPPPSSKPKPINDQ